MPDGFTEAHAGRTVFLQKLARHMISVGDPHGIVPTGMAERGTEGSEPQKRAVDIGLGPLNGGGGGNVAVGVGLAQVIQASAG